MTGAMVKLLCSLLLVHVLQAREDHHAVGQTTLHQEVEGIPERWRPAEEKIIIGTRIPFTLYHPIRSLGSGTEAIVTPSALTSHGLHTASRTETL